MGDSFVIGPMLTAFGFRSWYWACRTSRLVAIPAGFWVAVSASLPGAAGGLLGGLTEIPGRAKGNKLTARILSTSDDEVAKMPGAVVYPAEGLASITCKRLVLGTYPDFVVQTTAGITLKYGLANPLDFDTVLAALQSLYGDRVKRP